MDTSPQSGDTPDIEVRLARLESVLAERADTPVTSPMQRTLKYLPLLVVSNFLVAVPAFLLSVVVAYFTFISAEATEKMQIASVWPRVAYLSSSQSEVGAPVIRLSLTNKGVGPATINGMEIHYRGRAYATLRELLADCCIAEPEGLSLTIGSMVGEVLRPGDEMMFAQIGRGTLSDADWARIDEERLKLKVRVCYCSVFDDCWVAEDGTSKPASVASCPADWKQYYGAAELGASALPPETKTSPMR